MLRRHTLFTAVASSRDVAASHPFDCGCEQQGRCGVAPFSLLLRAAETLRRHTFFFFKKKKLLLRAAETLSNAECECVGECYL